MEAGIKRKISEDVVGGLFKLKQKNQVVFFDIGQPPKKNFSKCYQSGPLSFEYFLDGEKLQGRGKEGEELIYAPNNQTPFTGWAKSMYDNGQIKYLIQYKDGKKDGLSTNWYENGQKTFKEKYKDGKLLGLSTGWYDNGQRKWEKDFEYGKFDGLVKGWYENGQKQLEANFKDDKLMSAELWKPNGEICPESNLKDGTGVVVYYDEEGMEDSRETYKDGKLVAD